jgi:hypothetical protein
MELTKIITIIISSSVIAQFYQLSSILLFKIKLQKGVL